MKKLKAFACTTSIDTDLSMGASDIKIYSSLKALKSDRSCWVECGIYEIEITVRKIVRKPKSEFT